MSTLPLEQKLEEEGKKREVALKRQVEQASATARRGSKASRSTATKSRAETSKAVDAVAKRLKKKTGGGLLSPALSKLKLELEQAVSVLFPTAVLFVHLLLFPPQVQRNVEQAVVVENLQKRLSAREQDLRMLEELIVQRDSLLQGQNQADAVPPMSSVDPLFDTALASEIDMYFAADKEPRSSVGSTGLRTPNRPSALSGLQVDTAGTSASSELRQIFITPRGRCCSFVVIVISFRFSRHAVIPENRSIRGPEFIPPSVRRVRAHSVRALTQCSSSLCALFSTQRARVAV